MKAFKSLAVLASILALALPACDFGLGDTDFTLRFQPKKIETIVVGLFVDARTGVPLSGTLELQIDGPDANRIVNYQNEPQSWFAAEDGVISFALQDGFTPSSAAPAEFTVSVMRDGYVPASRKVTIARTGRHTFELRMINLDDGPEGIAIVRQTVGTASADGRLQQAFSLRTPGAPETLASASLEMPAGVRLLDIGGSPLVGSLTTTLLYLSNQDPLALSAFPGGFSVTADVGGVVQRGQFLSGGLMAVEIRDALGRKAFQMDVDGAPVVVRIGVPGITTNPETGAAVASGDAVPVWALRTEPWMWTQIGSAILQSPDANGNLQASLQIGGAGKQSQRLVIPGAFNVDWLWENVGELVLHFAGGDPAGTLAGEVFAPGNQSTFLIPPGPLPGNAFVVPDVACGIAGSGATIRVPGTAASVSVAADNLCTAVDVSIPTSQVCANPLRFEAYGVCPEDDVEIRRGNLAFYYANNQFMTPILSGGVIDGIVTMCVTPNTTYGIAAFVEGEQYELTLSVGGSVESFTVSAPGIDVRTDPDLNSQGLKQLAFGVPENVCGDL